jgi:ABC-type lipoprotein release transport system permease subunit
MSAEFFLDTSVLVYTVDAPHRRGAGTLTAVAALVAVVTAAASYAPVRRATRVDPAVVLRAE